MGPVTNLQLLSDAMDLASSRGLPFYALNLTMLLLLMLSPMGIENGATAEHFLLGLPIAVDSSQLQTYVLERKKEALEAGKELSGMPMDGLLRFMAKEFKRGEGIEPGATVEILSTARVTGKDTVTSETVRGCFMGLHAQVLSTSPAGICVLRTLAADVIITMPRDVLWRREQFESLSVLSICAMGGMDNHRLDDTSATSPVWLGIRLSAVASAAQIGGLWDCW